MEPELDAVVAAAVGAAVGAEVGAVVGAAVGAVVGAVVEAAVGAVVGTVVAVGWELLAVVGVVPLAEVVPPHAANTESKSTARSIIPARRIMLGSLRIRYPFSFFATR